MFFFVSYFISSYIAMFSSLLPSSLSPYFLFRFLLSVPISTSLSPYLFPPSYRHFLPLPHSNRFRSPLPPFASCLTPFFLSFFTYPLLSPLPSFAPPSHHCPCQKSEPTIQCEECTQEDYLISFSLSRSFVQH